MLSYTSFLVERDSISYLVGKISYLVRKIFICCTFRFHITHIFQPLAKGISDDFWHFLALVVNSVNLEKNYVTIMASIILV